MEIIGLDAGHDLIDPGAISPIRPEIGDLLHTKEAAITLAITRRLEGILIACGYKPIMTRTTESSVSLKRRTDILNQAKCRIAISVHINSQIGHTARYISTFIQGTGGQAEKLAKAIQPKLVRATGWPDGGVRVANLHMTRETVMPVVLVELGFLSNPEQEKQLNNPGLQAKLAAALAEGTIEYLGGSEPWQLALLRCAWDTEAAQAEIKRAGSVYRQKIAEAEAAHVWANKVRQASGTRIIDAIEEGKTNG